jgi:hypothetical protein
MSINQPLEQNFCESQPDLQYTRHTMYVQPNIEARSRNHVCRGKAIGITYSECVSVCLVIQHVVRMRFIILSAGACPALTYFFTLSHKRHHFRKKKLLLIKRVL